VILLVSPSLPLGMGRV